MEIRTISMINADDGWGQIALDLADTSGLFEYSRLIEHPQHTIQLDIDIDPGGGFEGGYAMTRFVAELKSFDDFRFSIQPKDFFDRVGKIFGHKELMLGYGDFDSHLAIKTNNLERVSALFSSDEIRQCLLSLPEFLFHIGHHRSTNTQVESAFLELRIEDGITHLDQLQTLYRIFLEVLHKVELDNESVLNLIKTM